MHDKRVAHRNLHVVIAGGKRASANGKANEPVSVMLALHHATTCGQAVDLLVDRRRLPGHVSLVLPERVLNGVQLEGFSANERESHADMLKAHRRDWRDALGRRIEEVGRHVERLEGVLEPEELECRRRHTRGLGELAHDRPLSAKADRAIVQNLTIDPGEPVWAALTIQLPEDTQPGSLYRLDAIQQAGRQIVGGSTYVVVVPERSRL
jgi:hypothetical protein